MLGKIIIKVFLGMALLHLAGTARAEEPGTLKWARATGGAITASPVIQPWNRIYITSGDGKLYGFFHDGSDLFPPYETKMEIIASPLLHKNRDVIYVACDDGLHAVTNSGKQIWVHRVGHLKSSTPALGTDGTLYVGSVSGKLYAISDRGLKPIVEWEFPPHEETIGQVHSSPAIGMDGTIYVGSDDGNLYALSQDGKCKWNFGTRGMVRSSPAIGVDGTIYVGSDNCCLYAIKDTVNQDGTPSAIQLWAFQTGNKIRSSPAIGKDGTIYVGSDDGKLYAIHPDGRSKWNINLSSFGIFPVRSSPAVDSNGLIYVGSDDGKLYAIQDVGQTAKKTWEFKTGDKVQSSPTIFNHVIYVGSNDGRLYAIYGGTSELDRSHWPKFHRDLRNAGNGFYFWYFYLGIPEVLTPALGARDNNTIYVSGCSKFYALNPDGTFLHEEGLGQWIESSPTIDATAYLAYLGGNDKIFVFAKDGSLLKDVPSSGKATQPAIGRDGSIYVGSTNGLIKAFHPDCTLNWTFTTGGPIYSSPAIGHDGVIYVGSDDGRVYALNPNGTPKKMHWPFQTGGCVRSSPAIGPDGTIYVGSDDGKVYAIKQNGDPKGQKWPFQTDGFVRASPAIGTDGTIYVGSQDYKLYALNPDGTLKGTQWPFNTYGPVNSTPAIGADGTIYLGSEWGKLYALNPNGTLKSVFSVGYTPSGACRSSPVIAENVVYWAYPSEIVAVMVSSPGPANSSWPMFRSDAQHTGRIHQPPVSPPVQVPLGPAGCSCQWAK